MNNRWCNPEFIAVKERVCSLDIELLAVGLRPFYPFTSFGVAVHIPPSADAAQACDVTRSVTAKLQTPECLHGDLGRLKPINHQHSSHSLWRAPTVTINHCIYWVLYASTELHSPPSTWQV